MVDLTTKTVLLLIATSHLITQAMDAPILSTKSINEIIQKNTLRLDLGTEIKKLAWSPNGNYIAGINTNNPSLKVWDIAAGKELWNDRYLFCHTQSIAFSPDSNHIAAIGYIYNHDSYRPPYNPHYLKIVETTTGKLKLRSDQFKNISCFAYRNDGKQIAMGVEEADFFDHTECLKIIDTQTGKFIDYFLPRKGFISSLAYSHDGTILALCLYEKDNNIVLIDAVTGILIKLLNQNDSIHSLQFYHNDISKLISCSKDRCLLWDLWTGTILKDFNKGDSGSTTFEDIALSKDNKKLITGKYRNFIPAGTPPREPYYCVTMFDTETRKVIVEFEKENVDALAYSPDMKKIVLAKWIYTNIITLPSDEEIKELEQRIDK